jgi:hypothetical protein
VFQAATAGEPSSFLPEKKLPSRCSNPEGLLGRLIVLLDLLKSAFALSE